jgi:excinuclease ABC subunit C
MLELNSAAIFNPSEDSQFFAALPEAPAVVRINPRPDLPKARPYLIRTGNLRRRMQRLLGLPAVPGRPETAGASTENAEGVPVPSLPSKRLSLRDLAASIDYRVAGSVFELAFIHWQQARRQDPAGYREKLRMRSPALIKMNTANPYPRCYVTRRIATGSEGAPTSGFYFGPFPSRRAAENFSSEFLNLFKIRRCQIKIRRDPSFPGCIYSEMKMCLAPCFAGCTDEEYAAEAARVHEFLATCGKSLTCEIETQREASSNALDFERAAEVHKRLEKVKEVLRPLPELVRGIASLDAIILQKAAVPEAIAAFVIRSGRITEPFLLRFGQSAEPRSAEEIFRDVLGAEPPPVDAQNASRASADFNSQEPLSDHLALLARWYYSKPRAGEIFFREQDWPYRKLIRACGRLLAADDAQSGAPPSAPKPVPKNATKATPKIGPKS